MLFLFFTDMAQPRNRALRLWSEISIWNYAYRQCTARIKITVAILVTDALVFRRIISYRSLTTGSTGKQLSQGLWDQGKVLRCISKDILNRWNNGRGNAAIASATTGKNHILSFSSVDQWPNCIQIFLYLWALHSSWNWSEHSCSKEAPGLVAAQCTFLCDLFESRYAYCNILLSNKIYLCLSTRDSA